MAKKTVRESPPGLGISIEERLRKEVEFFRSIREQGDMWRKDWEGAGPEKRGEMLLAQAEQMQQIIEHQESLDGIRSECTAGERTWAPDVKERIDALIEDLLRNMESLLGVVQSGLSAAEGLRGEYCSEMQDVRTKIRADQSYNGPKEGNSTYFVDRKI